MKSLITLGLFILISVSLMMNANAYMVSTSTTVTTTKYKYGCGKKHYTHHKRHYHTSACNRGCYRERVYVDTSFINDYWRYQGDYDPYACVGMENPASCSGPQRDYPDSCFQCGS